MHLDIAGIVYTDAKTPYALKGTTGAPVRAFADTETGTKHGNGSNGSKKSAANGASATEKARA